MFLWGPFSTPFADVIACQTLDGVVCWIWLDLVLFSDGDAPSP